MREIFSAKEAELAEVRSELAYTQQEMEAAKEEVTETQRDLTQARNEMNESQARVAQLSRQLEEREQDYRAERLQEELRQMREIEELRREFGWERRQWHAMMEDQGSLPKKGTRGIQWKELNHSMAGTETGEMVGDAELSSPEKSHSTRQELSGDQESSSDPATTESPEGQVANGVELDQRRLHHLRRRSNPTFREGSIKEYSACDVCFQPTRRPR